MREFWHELGSDKRYTPKWWWQRRPYIEGLRDAARIAELQAWSHGQKGIGPEYNCRQIVKAIHERSVLVAPELNK